TSARSAGAAPSFHCEMAKEFGSHQSDRRPQNDSRNRCFDVRQMAQKRAALGPCREEQTLEDSTKSSHGQIGGSDGVDEWIHHEEFTFPAHPSAQLPATSLAIASKNPTAANTTAASRLLFRPDLVVAQLPHENFLVYGPPGVIEHRRDASRAANFG